MLNKNFKPAPLLLLMELLIFKISLAQTDHQANKEERLNLWGVNYGINVFTKTSLEIGYGYMTGWIYHHGKLPSADRSIVITADLSSEFQIGKKFLLGPKISNRHSIGLWGTEFNTTGLIIGADYIAYNDLKIFNHVVRPSIGIHYFLNVFELSYGYNFRLDNNPASPINTHVIQLKFKPFIFIKSMEKMWGDKK